MKHIRGAHSLGQVHPEAPIPRVICVEEVWKLEQILPPDVRTQQLKKKQQGFR